MEKRSRQNKQQRSRNKKVRKSRRGCLFYIFGFILVLILAGLIYVGVSYFSLRKSFNDINLNHLAHRQEGPEQENLRLKEVEIGENPVSILIMGIDTGMDRTDTGRSDIMIVATVNFDTNKTTVTSIPRDSYVEIAGRPGMDKINHAYAFGGPTMAANTVQNLLEIPIDYTFSVDMEGFVDVIDALGGITITPIDTFEIGGYSFTQGNTQHMDGVTALQYVRNRQTDDGDYGRQERARQVVEAVVDELRGVSTIFSQGELFDVFSKYVSTNLTMSDLNDIVVESPSLIKNVEVYNLEGQGEMIDGVYYEILNPESVENVSEHLQENLEL